jgi:hypothetical protein
MLAKKTSKNQITLPKAIVEVFPDAQYFDVRVQDRKIILLPVNPVVALNSASEFIKPLTREGQPWNQCHPLDQSKSGS